ncbi:hypothetical protein RKD18_004954 [Streptomyces phaeoluteigriseus]
MAGVPAQADHAQLGPAEAERGEQLGGTVGAAVVDGDDLVADAQPGEDRTQPAHQRGKDLFLVVHGYDDRQDGRRRRGVRRFRHPSSPKL